MDQFYKLDIVFVPLLYLRRAFLPISMVVLSWVKRWWHHPIIGCLIALLLQAIVVILMILLVPIFPTLVISGLLIILATLIVALDWGAGPSLFSAAVGAILFNYFLLPPHFEWNIQDPQQVIETGVFLLVGVTISLLAGRTKHARLEAEAARSRLETLVARVGVLEQEALYQANRKPIPRRMSLKRHLLLCVRARPASDDSLKPILWAFTLPMSMALSPI